MPLNAKSIAFLTYEPSHPLVADAPLRYASGFFIETRTYGKVCVTCAHVVHNHPGPDRSVFYVNGYPSRVLLDADRDFGVDVALLAIPPEVLASGIHFHRLGRSSSVNRVYYSHGWSLLKGQHGAVEFVKVWGPRFDRSTVRDVERNGIDHTVWRLRNDVYDPAKARSFSTRNFAPGWSGAPVFNVRASLAEHAVVGVLSIVAEEEGEALAVSIERLDFLEPADAQAAEGWVGREKEPFLRRLADFFPGRAPAAPRYVIRFDADEEPSLYHLRFKEITAQAVSPHVPEPPSPYDSNGL